MNPGSVWPSKSCQSGSIKTKQYLLTEQLATQRISSWIRKQDNNPYSLGINSSGTKMNRERADDLGQKNPKSPHKRAFIGRPILHYDDMCPDVRR